jgi:hypothetical protein
LTSGCRRVSSMTTGPAGLVVFAPQSRRLVSRSPKADIAEAAIMDLWKANGRKPRRS